jgi:hypothetical protein
MAIEHGKPAVGKSGVLRSLTVIGAAMLLLGFVVLMVATSPSLIVLLSSAGERLFFSGREQVGRRRDQ